MSTMMVRMTVAKGWAIVVFGSNHWILHQNARSVIHGQGGKSFVTTSVCLPNVNMETQ